MANPDGSVIIDTKINTDGVDDGSKEIKKKMSQTADAAEGCADQIEDAFKNLDVSDGFKEQTAQIDAILSDTEASAKSKAAQIASVYKKAGDDQKTAFEKAWKAVKAASEDGSEKVKDDLDGISEKAKQAGQEINTGLGGIGKILGKAVAGVATVATLKEATEALADFGKEALKVGSDLQEVQNVVDVTFTTMADKVNEFAKSADASAGLSETMAKEYAGTFGTMAKSMGFAEAEAYELATALTQFTGDLASFRNLSQDEAFTKLQAIFTGETESLKALGVVMTQTNLDAFALANGFGKTTDAMTEQEKVSLRYQYVMDQLSAAQGDFVRTQDSWANQTKTLELQVENLKATFGEGLIGALSGTVQFINESVLPALQNFADYFAEAFDTTPAEEFRNSMESFKNTMADANTELEESMADMLQTSYAVDAVVESMTELEAAGLKTAESQRQYEAAVRTLNTLLPDLNAQIDKNTGLIDKNTQEIYENLKAMKEQVKYKVYQKMLEANEAALDDLATAYTNLYTAQFQQEGIEKQLQEAYGLTTEQVDKLKEAFIGMSDELGDNTQHTDRQRVALAAQRAGIANTTPEMKKLISALSDATVQEAELSVAIQEQETALEEVMPMLEQYKEEVLGIEDATKNAAESLESMSGEISESAASGALSGTSDIVAGVMDELSLETDRTYSELTQGLGKNADVIRQHIENLAALMSSGAPDSLISQFTNSNSATMAALNEAMQASNGQFTELIGNFNEYERATQELRQVISDWEHQTELTAVAATQSLEGVWAQYQQQSIDWVQSRMKLVNTESDKAKSEARMLVNEAEKLADEASEYFSKSYKAKEEENYQQAAKYRQMAVEKQREAREILAEAQKLYGSEGTVGIIEDAMKRVEGASQSLSGAVEETTNSISDNFEEVVGFLESKTGISADRIREIVFGSRDEVVGAVEEAGEAAADASKKASDEVVDNTEVAIDKIQSLIWGLDGTEVVIDIFERVHRAEGYAYGYAYDSYDPQSYSIPYSVPYLAEGAVIPPNAPFMAVLGDQRNGTNLEAPADLIRQIVREEMESIELGVDVNFSGDLAPLISLLTPKITAEQRRNSRAGGY